MTTLAKPFRYARRAMDYMAYAHRPMLWPAMARNIVNKLCGRIPDRAAQDRQRAEAVAWAQRHVVDEAEAMARLGFPAAVPELDQAFPQIMQTARALVSSIPVRMGGPGQTALIHALCENLGATRVVETGVACGWSSLAILLSLRDRPGAQLCSIDLPYFERHNDQWVGAAVPEDLRGAWTLFRMADREGLPRALKQIGAIDFAHYDSDKSVAGRLYAYPLLWQALRPGGILMSDDAQDNMGFALFCEKIGREPIIVRKGAADYAGILRK